MASLSIYFLNYLKLIFIDFRPSFLSNEIDSKNCRLDYGKPSGHALMSSIAIPLCMYQIFKNNIEKTRLKFIIISSVSVFLVIFSRLYLAKHSINQLILGCLFGLSILFTWWGYGPVSYTHLRAHETRH